MSNFHKFEFRAGSNQHKQKKPNPLRSLLAKLKRGLQKGWDVLCMALFRLKALGTKALAVIGAAALVLIATPIIVVAALSHSNPATPPAGSQAPQAAFSQGLPGDEADARLEGNVLKLSATPSPSPTASPTPTPEPTPEPTPTLHPHNAPINHADEGPIVAKIQERLMELNYMENDEPTEYYGSSTERSIRLFQRQHELDVDGLVGKETYDLLMSEEAQKYTVMLGADGTDVKELQKRLRNLGYMDDVTGHFGEKTVEAVKKFQQLNNLSVDGKVGAKTREALYSPDSKANFLKYGDNSDDVKKWQQKLKDLGYLTTTPDGNYGPDTKTAVARFQDRNGLIADGFLGYETTQVLKSGSARANALQLTDKGSDVENMQKQLKKLGYMKDVTGYFGELTEAAVKAFQKRNSLGQDGIAGKVTMTKLFSSSAKSASGSSSSSSGSSSSSSSGSSSSNSSGADKLISIAKSKLGSKYVWGSKGPNTFDCSGFVYWCLNQSGVKVGYMTSAGWQTTNKFQRISSMGSLKKGDILSFKGHVGIYMGGGQMIDASDGKGQVRTTSINSSYWERNFVCAYRVF